MNVDFAQLADEVDRVRNTVARDDAVEIYTWLCWRDGKLTSFSGTAGTVTKSSLTLEFCIDAKRMQAVLGVLKKKHGTMELRSGWLHITSGSYETKLPTTDVEDFPHILPKAGGTRYCEATNLVEALKVVTAFVEKDAGKVSIFGIGMRGNYVYSTDSKRVTRAQLNSPVLYPKVLSKGAVDQLIRLGQPQYLFSADENIGAIYPEQSTAFMARGLAASFPYDTLDKVFENKGTHCSTVPSELRDVVDRVCALIDDDEHQLDLEGTGTLLRLSTTSISGGSTETLACFMGLSFKCKVKSDSLQAVLRKLKPDTIDLTDVIAGAQRMLLFRGLGYETAMGLMS